MSGNLLSKKLRNRILIFSALWVLCSCAGVALVAIGLIYTHLKADAENSLLMALKGKSVAVEELLARMEGIAWQVASRSALAEKLDAYNKGAITPAELTDFSRPRLLDAMARSAELAGISRFDRRGNLVAEVGLPLPRAMRPEGEPQELVLLGPVAVGEELFLCVAVPIFIRQSETIGSDLALFRLSGIRTILSDRTGLGPKGRISLSIPQGEQVLLLSGEEPPVGEVRFLQEDSPIRAVLEKSVDHRTGILHVVNKNGVGELVAHGPIEHSNWVLTVRMEAEDVYRVARRGILAIGGFIAFLVFGGAVGMIAILQPLTGRMILHSDDLEAEIRKKTEALGASREEYRLLFEGNPHPMWVYDLETLSFLAVNDAAVRSYGYSPEEFRHMRLPDIHVPEAAKGFRDTAATLEEEYGRAGVWKQRRKDGALLDAEIITHDITFDGVAARLTISMDVTERIRAEVEVRRVREHLEALVEERTEELVRSHESLEREIEERKEIEEHVRARNSLLGLQADAASRQEYLDTAVALIQKWSGCSCVGIRILDARGAIPYASFTGFSNEFWQSENELFPCRDQCICTRIVSGNAEPQDLPCMTPKGSFWCVDTMGFLAGLSSAEKARFRGVCIQHGFATVCVIPIRARDGLLGAIHLADRTVGALPAGRLEFLEALTPLIGQAIVQFATKEKLEQTYEAQNLIMEKLEASNRALQEFASIASHDMKEPLRKIIQFGDLLFKESGEVLNETGRDYLMRMQRAAERMTTLIQALLDYSRVTTKAAPFRRVDLAGVVQEVLDDLEVRILETGGQVEVRDLPVVWADPHQMQQLFQNLIANGLKFHRQGVKPLVRVFGELLDAGRRCRITVEDNGIGFNEKGLERLFQPFQRLHGKSSPYEGTGMGLAICKRIVERHNGSIVAKGTPGGGATFTLVLPVGQETA